MSGTMISEPLNMGNATKLPLNDNASYQQQQKLSVEIAKKSSGTNSLELHQRRVKQNLQVAAAGEDYLVEQGKSVVHYILNPHELRNDHPVWHYAYLIVLIFAAFIALFIGPVVFGMLATFGGIGAPFILSLAGAGAGLFAGLVFGVVFAVVCIVGLIRVVGYAAGWVLDTLWLGGNDMLDITRNLAQMIVDPSKIQHQHQ
ncbi:7093_t:CDS:1 [Ambispora gerdemannii]|uniref:7093_t:CDS:1 n=1 Tax=Ambispora gerdemannii TaxID=144530 RepID=A0A9N8YU72_9GLOM|nr:7093_t:CDS:1 [Ambispora gerdemannii]